MGSKKKTTEDMIEWLKLDGRGITIVGEYENNKTKTEFQCSHNHRWLARPDGIKTGRGCPQCADTKGSTEAMNKWLSSTGSDITMISTYLGALKKSTFKCSVVHHSSWESSPSNIKQGRGCPECNGGFEWTTSNMIDWLKNDGRGISIIGEYFGNHIKSTFKCHNPSHQPWLAAPNRIKQGAGCPACAKSGFKSDVPAWEYAFTRNGYLKFGITNDLIRRLNEHRKHGEITVVHERYHEIGRVALDWETNIKRTIGSRFVTKEQCPDGWTETLPIHLLEEIKR